MFKSNSFDNHKTIGTKPSDNKNNLNDSSKTPGRRPAQVEIAVPATTSKVSSSSATPGRNFFKKLFRTPGKSTVKRTRGGLVITPSNEGKLGFAAESRELAVTSSAIIRRSNSAGNRTDFSGAIIALDHSTSHSTETEGSYSVATQKRINSRFRQSFSLHSPSYNVSPSSGDDNLGKDMTSNSPPIARRLLAEEDLNAPIRTETSSNKEDTMVKQDSRPIPIGITQQQTLDDALLAATKSPERQNDLIFVAQSSSSSEADDCCKEQRNDVSPMKRQLPPMGNRGISIPTPAINKRSVSGSLQSNANLGIADAFARPLRRVADSPVVKKNLKQHLESEQRTKAVAQLDQAEDDEEDDAFLPDDFQKPGAAYSEDELQKKIEDAKRTVLEDAKRDFDRKVNELERAYNTSLVEHGLEWRREKEAERDRFTARIAEEKAKTTQHQQEMMQQRELIDELHQKLKEYEERESNITVVQDEALMAQELYKNQLQEKIASMKEHLLELQTEKSRSEEMSSNLSALQQAKDESDQRIQELESELKTVKQDTLVEDLNHQLLAARTELNEMRERDMERRELERLVTDLEERLRVQTETNNTALNQLETAENEIISLKSELSDLSTVKQKFDEELQAAKTDIEKLRNLRIEHENELESMRCQMERVDEQYRAVLYSPQKSTGERTPESPCSQVDILRIDNNKVHEQLKAMGKVLKRYKAERDEIKTKMVQTVEVAVKQAQEGMQEKMEAATKQLDQARIEADHLKKKLAEEMKKLAEKENAVEVITDRFQKEREELEVAHEAAIQKYENEIRLARSKVEEQVVQNDRRVTEYEQLQKQMDRMQALHIEEVELVQQEARQEIKVQLQNKIDALQAQLASIQKEKQDLETKFNELKMQLREIQNQHDKEKLSADRRLREMQSHHRKEIDELTAELDLFEAENVENIRKLQESLKEKETVISAMGSQLAESESRCSNSSETQSLQQRRIQELEEELKKAHGEKAAREQELTDQIILREKAIEDVANELTAKAEKQFEERNELYRVLKKKFDEATSKISVLERDLRFAKKELEEVKKRHEASEADLKDELAQSKAAVAKSDANLARAEKNHRAELQRSKEELEAAKATSQQIQKSLAIVVNEKEKLAAEVVDLKNISEELMAMVEEKGLA